MQFSLFNFSSIFQGDQLTPFATMCGRRPCPHLLRRRCRRAPAPAVGWYFMPARRSAANPPIDGTDRHMEDARPFNRPAPNTMRAVSIIGRFISQACNCYKKKLQNPHKIPRYTDIAIFNVELCFSPYATNNGGKRAPGLFMPDVRWQRYIMQSIPQKYVMRLVLCYI